MSPATATSATLLGMTGHLVGIQAEPATDHPCGLVILGPNGRSMPEARDRIWAALINAGLSLPEHGLTISLPPSDDPPPGPSTDLAMAALVLAATGLIPATALDATVLIGEVGLDGAVRPVRGVLPMVLTAAGHGIRTVVLPAAHVGQADLVPGVQAVLVDSLRQFAQWATTGELPPLHTPPQPLPPAGDAYTLNLAHVPATMARARWALEVAAAGGHNLGLIGPHGAGKTLLAHCLPTLLPDLDDDAALEATLIRSAAGLALSSARLLRRPPLRIPHHSDSLQGLLGGGPRAPRAGTVSLAHHGVLFMEDTPEFSNRTLSALRQVVDVRQVQLAGAGGTVTYPAWFQLVLAAQPCPCLQPADAEPCTCTAVDRRRYLARMAELWQRTDIRLRLDVAEAHDTTGGESSATVAARVARARELAADRWAALGYRVNADVPGSVLRDGACRLPARDISPLLRLLRLGLICGDGHDRILRLAWSIGDLRDRDRPHLDDVNAAIELYVEQP